MRPRTRSSAGLGIAFAGAVAGHGLTYLLVAPNRHLRDEVLATSGHGYLPAATFAAASVGVYAVMLLFLRGARGRGSVSFARLLAMQAMLFVCAEIIERVASGAPLGTLVHVLPVGLLIQSAIAAMGAIATASIVRTSVAVARAIPRIAVPIDHVALGIHANTASGAAASASTRIRSIRAPPAISM